MTDDCISGMPDDILSFILSYLSMRDAVRSKLLSSRWRNLCAYTLNLNFDIFTVLGIKNRKWYSLEDQDVMQHHKSRFVKGVDQFLEHYHGERLDSFKVSFFLGNECSSYIDRWISSALRMRIRRLDLRFSFFVAFNSFHHCLSERCKNLYDFPCHLLPQDKSHQLEFLRLKACLLRPSPNLIDRLSSLKTLFLKSTSLEQKEIDSILSGCSNLEMLRLKNSNLPETFLLCSPHLCLKFFGVYNCEVQRIELSSKGLVIFEYIGRIMNFKLLDAPQLAKVYFDFTSGFGMARSYLFGELANDLSEVSMLSLCFPTSKLSPVPARITRFNHLKTLQMIVILTPDFDLFSLTHIINAAPLLQELILAFMRGAFTPPREKIEYQKLMHTKLEQVTISRGFSGSPNVLEFALYVVDNVVSLKRMILRREAKFYHGCGKWSTWQKLSPYSGKFYSLLRQRAKGSPRLKIMFL